MVAVVFDLDIGAICFLVFSIFDNAETISISFYFNFIHDSESKF